ncbi:DUF5677 domain-containing protein [Bacillus salipaludis]|uniref:DUF5677 domain-containing protein n=1 Tax=Bacillus salipaludis TaxID=2547811 RepID=A0AA90TWH1_9BACI|nr:DUF5677 domain-containing protein [Bacillus salipaludis]MDQ6600755.1 DUF5677 domain-containing protein [Bacillus salipaludis]
MDSLSYSLFDLDFPDELNKLSKVIRYSHSTLKKLAQISLISYEEITVLTLYRKLIENIDGILVLVDSGLDSPSTSVIRSAYEIFMQLEFILENQKEFKSRARSYYSTWLFEEITFIEKQLKSTHPLLEKEILLLKLQKNNQLLDKEFKNYKIEIQNTMKRLNLRYPPKWYSLFNGPKSLGELSKETSLQKVHNILYNGMSAEAHGLNSITDLSTPGKNLILQPIRKAELSLMPINLGRTFLTATTHKIVDKYLPNEFEVFRKFIITLFDEENKNS